MKKKMQSKPTYRYILKKPNGKFYGDLYERKFMVNYPYTEKLFSWEERERHFKKAGYRIVKVMIVEVEK